MIEISLFVGAFVAGVLMFLAPCTLPIVPGYLAFIAGGSERKRVVGNAVMFVLGFSLVFILLGVFAGALGGLLGPWKFYLGRAAGVVLILFGLTMLGFWRVPLLSTDRRIKLPVWLSVGSPHSSFFIGSLFALGWSPCIGPILGTILLVASVEATALQGALLLGIFSVGMALPFLLCALALERAQALFVRMGGAARALSVAGGIILILLGLLMLTGTIGVLNVFVFEGLLNYL